MENVNEIIDSICNKLGTTVEFVVSEYARMAIVGNVVLILVIFAVGYGGYIGLRKLHKFCDEECSYEAYLAAAIVIAIAFVIFGAANIIISSMELAQAITSPHAFFVKAVMEAIK